MKDNYPDHAAMIALIELAATNDESMQKSFDIYADNCGSKIGILFSKAVELIGCAELNFFLDSDPCETAAKIFKCEVENDPTVAAEMVWKRNKTKMDDSMVNLQLKHFICN
jgi:hypothetical protein